MRAGTLDRKITIEQPTESVDALGSVSKTWATLKTVAAGVRPLKQKEASDGGAVRAVRESVFTIRPVAGLTSKVRIVYDGLVWNIRGIAELGRGRGYELTAEAEE